MDFTGDEKRASRANDLPPQRLQFTRKAAQGGGSEPASPRPRPYGMGAGVGWGETDTRLQKPDVLKYPHE